MHTQDFTGFLARSTHLLTAALLLPLALDCQPAAAQPAVAQPPASSQPSETHLGDVPANRQAMLTALEALKGRTSRLPLPAADQSPNTDGREVVNNRLIREHYLSDFAAGRRVSSLGPPISDDEYRFSTQLFWIVSRLNDCHYCLGHQESKLRRAGLEEPWLLALDTDWDAFPEPQRAAFEFTRRLSLAPHQIGDADIERLRAHFTDDEVLRMVLQIGRYHAMNRWTDATGIPQETYRDFASELPPASLALKSQVAVGTYPRRDPPSDFDSWRKRLEQARNRTARLRPSAAAGPDRPKTRAERVRQPTTALVDLPEESPRLPHEQLLAAIPEAGPWVVQQIRDTFQLGELDRVLKDKLAMAAAIQDDAVYMQLLLLDRLRSAGLTDQQIFALGTSGTEGTDSPADRAALAFAIRSTVNPIAIEDADISQLLAHFTPQQTAEVIHLVGTAAMLNRLTEAVGIGPNDTFQD
ncbi:MAG: hypothetical protein EA381_07800 [Planctomycetaceae bacterium]|nr:MAG: hypothetical protein EA381_07800 [Planctomycetaceae bacterium]